MAAVIVQKLPDFEFVKRIDDITPAEACFLPDKPDLVYRIVDVEHYGTLTRDQLIEGLMKSNQ